MKCHGTAIWLLRGCALPWPHGAACGTVMGLTWHHHGFMELRGAGMELSWGSYWSVVGLGDCHGFTGLLWGHRGAAVASCHCHGTIMASWHCQKHSTYGTAIWNAYGFIIMGTELGLPLLYYTAMGQPWLS